jgi:hypothetical protein
MVLKDVSRVSNLNQPRKVDKMVEVRWNGRGPAQRVQDRLKQVTDGLKPSAQTEMHHITRTTIYYGSSQSPSRGYGSGPDPVAAAIASKGGIQR